MKKSMRRVPFVDDGAKALEKLQQMHRSQDIWEMAFAPSGEVPLVDASPFDVIPSDLRMPGRDGAISAYVLQLLNSALFGPMQPIAAIRSAVSYLEIDVLRTLVISAEIF